MSAEKADQRMTDQPRVLLRFQDLADLPGLHELLEMVVSNFEAWLEGMIAYVSVVNKEQDRRLAEALAQVG